MSFFELYRGEISGLLGACFFGVGNAIYRRVSAEMDLISMNLLRSALGFFFFMILTVIVQDLATIFSLDRYVVLMLAISVLCNIVIGDLVYFKAQNHIGVSKAFPIANLTPLLTLFLAFFLLGEPLTERLFVGVLFVIGGVYFIARPSNNELFESTESVHRQIGFGLAFLSTLFWTVGILTTRIAMREIDAVSANSVRYGFAILFLWLISSFTGSGSVRKIGTYNRQTIKIVTIATVFNIMLGALFWVDSVKYAGASKAAIFAATRPLFALPVSVTLLGESVSWKAHLGTLMTIIGLWLVI